jgi:hypothetical protein
MARADRLSQLITQWQERRQKLIEIEAFFRDYDDVACVNIARFGRGVLERCIEEFQRENYPLDKPLADDAVDQSMGIHAMKPQRAGVTDDAV